MFTVVYHFKVKAGHEASFEKSWHAGTELIRQERNSLGSRLHLSSDGLYIAYAQWRSRNHWQNSPAASENLKAALKQMHESLLESGITYELEVIDDLLAR